MSRWLVVLLASFLSEAIELRCFIFNRKPWEKYINPSGRWRFGVGWQIPSKRGRNQARSSEAVVYLGCLWELLEELLKSWIPWPRQTIPEGGTQASGYFRVPRCCRGGSQVWKTILSSDGEVMQEAGSLKPPPGVCPWLSERSLPSQPS